MPLLKVNDLCLSHGRHVLLEHADFALYRGDRICLVGRNGAGKSTLLKLIEGEIKPDHGDVWIRPGVRVARLEQELPHGDDATVAETVASGLAELGALLLRYQALASQPLDEKGLRQLEDLQHDLEAQDGWRFQQAIDETLSRLSLDGSRRMGELSGGWRRRVALARALVVNPDILLLDEPTNHLDVETIQWLERDLLSFRGALLFITHDRALARSLASSFLELDRGHLYRYDGNYDQYLEQREQRLTIEARDNALFDKRLAEEERWIRQGVKARRTRNEGRVRALEQLRRERGERRELQGKARFGLEAASSSGKLVVELQDVSMAYGGRTLIDHFNFSLQRGDKVGLLGPNGAGKSTLLKLIIGALVPQQGVVKMGTKLEVAYFDQMRDRLDDNKTVVDIVGGGRDSISINGRDKHILSYLSDFLFTPERARSLLKSLSGGERNRVQLACLFSLPANLLVLDEPTNDLDVETLELLEAILVEFPGTVLLVSHDREFMDNVVTSTLAFEGEGQVREYVGGFQDWLRQGGSFHRALTTPKASSPAAKAAENSAPVKTAARKLSFKLQRELDELPARIEALEAKQQQLQEVASAADFYQQPREQVSKTLAELSATAESLETAYARWVELSES